MKIQDYKYKVKDCLNNRKINYTEYIKQKYGKFKNVCIFGVGNLGRNLPVELQQLGISVNFFCDNDKNKVGRVYDSIPCISVEELDRIKDNTVVIIATRYYKEIYQQLRQLGFKNLERIFSNKFQVDSYFENNNIDYIVAKIFSVIDILADEESVRVYTRIIEEWCRNEYSCGQIDDIYSLNQYFDNNIIQLEENEIFVDCGAYNGDTLDALVEETNGVFQKAYLFELSSINYKILENRLKERYADLNSKIVAVNSGVSNITSDIFYCEDDEGSTLSSSGNVKGQVVGLSEYFTGKNVTFIKMDIEGAELAALEGAEQLIKRCNPKLAICLYHKPQDLWEIPLFIKELVPNYKIYIRHYTDLLNETVCYATI